MNLPKGWSYIKPEDADYHPDERRVYQKYGMRWVVVVVLEHNPKKFYVAPALMSIEPDEERRGPYMRLKDACTAAETMYMLNALPSHWVQE